MAQTTPQTKEWTLMFYFASDNPLASTIVSQLKALKDAGYHPDANVIAHFDPHAVNTPVHIFDVNHVTKYWYPDKAEVGFDNSNPFIRDMVLDRLWGEKNEGIRTLIAGHVEKGMDSKFDPPKPSDEMYDEQKPVDALTSFLKFCRESYPARHYMLFILGHGQVVGNDTLLLDDHATEHSLTLTQLGQILRSFNADVQNDRDPGAVELITLHSCSMSAVEVAYELKGAAKYLLASQGPTYVGNLPYKQILIRVFKDLNSKLSDSDIHGVPDPEHGKQSLVERLFNAAEPVSQYLRGKLKPKTTTALANYTLGNRPENDLVLSIVNDFNDLLANEDTYGELKKLTLSNGNDTHRFNGVRLVTTNRRRFNRQLLSFAYPEIGHSIDWMITKIFFYCLYNSYDFQLAGYPYDLCLTNLTKVPETEDPINNLADKLIKGLEDKDSLPKQLILLAHWDAQSFYQEDYVDLYDFCLCLMNRCNERKAEAQKVSSLNEIFKACESMTNVLERAPENLIVLSAFSGPAFQYSHGLSIYFPWTRPVDNKMWDEQYAEYRLNRETKWRQFLEAYFDKTMRRTRDEELQVAGLKRSKAEQPIAKQLLGLMSRIGSNALFGDGRLQKPGPDHPMGKWGPDDPTGANCSCATIKNYPAFTGVSENFLDGDGAKTAMNALSKQQTEQ